MFLFLDLHITSWHACMYVKKHKIVCENRRVSDCIALYLVRADLQSEAGRGEAQVLGLPHLWGAFYLLLLGNGMALLLLAGELLTRC